MHRASSHAEWQIIWLSTELAGLAACLGDQLIAELAEATAFVAAEKLGLSDGLVQQMIDQVNFDLAPDNDKVVLLDEWRSKRQHV